MAQVFCIERFREELSTGKKTHETVYAVTSLSAEKASPERLLELARGHWCIENRVHYVRDVTFGEDQWRIRRFNAPYIMSSLASLAVNLLRLAGVRYIPTGLRHCAFMGEKVIRFLGLRL